jgi:hypothetical protein
MLVFMAGLELLVWGCGTAIKSQEEFRPGGMARQAWERLGGAVPNAAVAGQVKHSAA